jgi:hypothetical protein
MTVSDTPVPGERPRREMSADEKLIAEWEARHDVAARGHRPDPQAVQHYLSRAHVDEHGRPTRPRPDATSAGTPASTPAPAPEERPRRPWWRRLTGRS